MMSQKFLWNTETLRMRYMLTLMVTIQIEVVEY